MNKGLRMGAASCALLAGEVLAVDFEMVSLRSDNTPPSLYSDASQQPAISGNGRYVAFIASAPNLTAIGATGNQVYLRDRLLGTTELVSVSTTGGGADNSTSNVSISDDGCRVAFTSGATNLVVGDTNARNDVFVRDRCVGPATVRASVSSAGVQGNAGSVDGRISADGKHVVFVSDSTNLAAGTGQGFNCLFKRDLDTSTTTAINTSGGACIQGNVPDISGDGQRIVFWGQYSPGTVTQVNGVWQVYVYDFAANPATQPTIVSSSAANAPQSLGSEGVSTVSAPAISVDGGYVAFASRGAGLVATVGGGFYHVYLKQLATGAITRVSVDTAGNVGNGNSSGGGQGLRPGLSRSAAFVTFTTSATNLAPETGGFFPNVVARSAAGTTVGFLASASLNGQPAISSDSNLIVANGTTALDTHFATRGMFAFAAPSPRLANISTRMQVLTNNDVMIAGFIVGGTTPKRIVVNVAGPSLVPFGITNALANPTLTLVRSSDQSVIATNDNWQTQTNPADVAAITASGFQPNNTLEPALIATLPPGAYTAIVQGFGSTTGVGLVGVFEVDHPEVPLINISTRGQVLTNNDVMIAGIIVQGAGPRKVVINVAGPSLIPFGITNALANPTLTLVRSSDQVVIATNDDWQTQTNPADVAAIQATGFQPNNPAEPALILTLPPGAYTAIVQGAGGTSGVGLVGVFTAP